MRENTVKVWDPLVRVGHWALVVAFVTAFVTEGELMPLHAYAGYLVISIIALRVLWGFVGTEHARFGDFVRGPRTTARYLGNMLAGRADRHIGHNPAGAAMILALIVALIGTASCGMVLYGIEEGAGPLAGWVAGRSLDKEAWEEAHELFANGTMFLVALHVAGVVYASRLHRENLVKAMFDGRKRARD